MSEYIITLEQMHDLITSAAVEAVDGYKWCVVKQIWSFPKLSKIVRCSDCKHYTHSSWHRCDLYSIAHEVEPDGFCAWGERRGR